MKILVNGNTVTEMICEKITEVRDFRKHELIECDFDSIEDLNFLDKAVAHIKKNKYKYMFLVVMIALTMDLSCVSVLAASNKYASIDAAGIEILNLIRKAGYWICIILCSKDVVRHAMRGHFDGVGSIVAIYCLVFGSLYFIPWIFDIIKTIF